jgi:uncharacterized protein (TIGR03067 family)
MTRHALVIVLAGLLPAAAAGADPAKPEGIKLQGTWTVAASVVDGVEMPLTAFRNVVITVQGDQITFKDGDKVYDRITVVLKPSAKPRAADWKHTAGLKEGKTELGIYDLKGDTLTLCFAHPGQQRPATFVSKRGTGLQLYTLKRAK